MPDSGLVLAAYPALVPVHACAMVVAAALMLAGELLFIAARAGRARPARLAFRAIRFAGYAAGVGMVAGIALLLIGGWPLRTPWLAASLVLVVAMMAVEGFLVRPWQELSLVVLQRDDSGPGVSAVARDARGLSGRLVMITLFVVIGVLMIAKPVW